jgi:hypothetical protein
MNGPATKIEKLKKGMTEMKKGVILMMALFMMVLPIAGCKAAATTKAVDINDVYEAVKKEMGDGYKGERDLQAQDFADMFGIAAADMDDFYGQISTMSLGLDFFIAVKAKTGKADAIEKCLQDWRTGQIDAGKLYPFEMAKMKASQVIRHGDYVFLVTAGANYSGDDPSEENVLESAKKENQRAVDAINKLFV